MFGLGKIPDVKNKALTAYRNTQYGGMTGGGRSATLRIINGEAILTESVTNWWYEDARITEYKVDRSVLADIEGVFRKYSMQRWHNKKFTDMFVCDGPNFGYSFTFEGNIAVSFSSQVYPIRYSKKLSRIDDLVEEYRKKGTLEPGLVTIEKTAEEWHSKQEPENGLVTAEVCEYSSDRLCFRISNGTDEQVSVSNSVKLVRNNDGAVLYERNSEYPIEAEANKATEETIRLTGRLSEGLYTLFAGDHTAEFEIRLPEKI